ncbi:MAG: 16S rRNA (cytosine(1407)-C(5))-methyltransferase RsmF [Anaerolineales bacterium]
MQPLLGADFAAFQAALQQPALAGLRTNTLKLTPAQLQSLVSWSLAPLPWSASGFLLPQNANPPPGKYPYHAAGLYYLQEPAAIAAAELLNPQPGERVLDLAAAPGGKTTHLAALMQNRGVLIANEIHPQRAWVLAENLERMGVTNAAILHETPLRLAEHFGGWFDKVLLDAPCSGEGMFRKSEIARREWSLQAVQACAVRQRDILRHAAQLVRPGGLLLYVTCTFNPHENEAVIAEFLAENPHYEMMQVQRHEGFSFGMPEWIGADVPTLRDAVRLFPHRAPAEGHFLALVRRVDSGTPRRLRDYRVPQAPALARADLHRAWQDLFAAALPNLPLVLEGSYWYALPQNLPDLRGLKVLHPGAWLGVAKKNRVEPAHALALQANLPAVVNTANFAPDDPALLAYLRGENVPASGENGWTLVAVDGFGLGWGKRVNGVLKSHYPRGLRWLEASS